MNVVGVVGSGYVGTATALTLGLLGNEVICGDIDQHRVAIINQGESPVHEKDFEEKIKELNNSGKLSATTDIEDLTSKSDIIFICVDTPENLDGSSDLSAVEMALQSIKNALKDQLVVIKSTVTPGTTRKLAQDILGRSQGVCHNPEFLREGNALEDSLNPDRVVVGALDEESGKRLMQLYEPIDCPKIVTDPETSEMIKYASNAFLAMKVTYANEMANICEQFGVDVYEVLDGVKLDNRIDPKFLEPGTGFGGSCFKKDLGALISASEAKNYEPLLLNATLNTNQMQPLRVVELLERAVGDITGKRVAVLGLSFKPESADVRNSCAIPIVIKLKEKGVVLTLYDPMAADNFKALGFQDLHYAESLEDALTNQEAIIIQTKWQEFTNISTEKLEGMVVIDGRRALDPEKMLQHNIRYLGIGWKNI